MRFEEDEREYWGERLKAWPASRVSKCRIPVEAAEYLSRVGLPGGATWNFQPSDEARPAHAARGMVIIMYDGVAPICIDEVGGGRIVALEEHGTSVRFVNSSVRMFGRFLSTYQQYRCAVDVVSDEEGLMLVDEVETQFARIDQRAMEVPDNYWPVIVEQMRYVLA